MDPGGNGNGKGNGDSKAPIEVLAKLETLPHEEAVILGTLHGLSARTIAERNRCSIPHVYKIRKLTRVRKALAQMRDTIAAEFSDTLIPGGKMAAKHLGHLMRVGQPGDMVQVQAAKAVLDAAIKVIQLHAMTAKTMEMVEEVSTAPGSIPVTKLSRKTRMRILDELHWGSFDDDRNGNGTEPRPGETPS